MSISIILDTNVISEMMLSKPDPQVVTWHLQQKARHLFTTTITVAEVLFGLAVMQHRKRRDGLQQVTSIPFKAMQPRILPFDEQAANFYAFVRAEQQKTGESMGALDAQIAAIALVAGAFIATRNIAHFEHCGTPLLNPWTP